MRIIYVLICITTASNAAWNVAFRGSLGPSWHRYNFFELFDIPIQNGEISLLPTTEYLQMPYMLMPYGEIATQLHIGNFFLEAYGGGGSFKKGIGTIALPFSGIVYENSNSFRQELPSITKASLALVETFIGYNYSLTRPNIIITPLIGYIYAKQSPTFYVYDVDTTFKHITRWQGPSLGFSVNTHFADILQGCISYKFSPAKLNTIIQVNSPLNFTQEVFFLSDATYSTVCGRAWGNEVEGKIWYTRNLLSLGLGITYLQFNNAKVALVNLGSTNTYGNPELTADVIQGSTLPKIVWQQLIVKISFEVHF